METVEADLLRPRCGLSPDRYEALCSRVAADHPLRLRHPLFRAQAPRNHGGERPRPAGDPRSRRGQPGAVLPLHQHGLRRGDGRAPAAPNRRRLRASSPTSTRKPRPGPSGTSRTACRRLAIPFTMIRPSIVYGDSRTGRSTRFNALYFHVKSLQFIRDIYLNDMRTNGGRKSREHGVVSRRRRRPPSAFAGLSAPSRKPQPRPDRLFRRRGAGDHRPGRSGCRLSRDERSGPNDLDELAAYCESFLKIKGIGVHLRAAGRRRRSVRPKRSSTGSSNPTGPISPTRGASSGPIRTGRRAVFGFPSSPTRASTDAWNTPST